MKKTLYSLCMLAGAAAMLSSCADERLLETNNDGNVTFNVTVPGSLDSRVYADGTTAQQNVMYYVYDQANGAGAEPVLTGNVTMASLKGTVTVGLATGHKYDVVFLATAPTGAPYTYSTTGRTLTIDPTALTNSAEALDAFYDVLSFEVKTSKSYDAKLTRPFAQLNIGTKDVADYEAVTGKTVAKTSVTISQIYTTLDLMTDTPSMPEANVTYTSAALPTATDGTFPVTYTPEGSTTAVPYTYLAMDYILVPADDKDMVEVTMTVEGEDGTVLETKEYNNIPLQGNYRTNIYGALLTSQQEFNVEILPGFADEDYNIGLGISEPKQDATGTYLMTTEAELAWLAQQVNSGAGTNNMAGKTFSLQNDIYLSEPWTPIGGGGQNFGTRFSGTFEGNGHTIYNMEVNAGERAGFFGFSNGVVQNLNFDNAHITSNHWAGIVVGYSDNETGSAKIVNCKVTNSSVTLATEYIQDDNGNWGWDNGDKGGMIIGYMATRDQVTGCTVENCVLQGYRDLGGIIGYANGSVITDNTVNGLTIYVDNSHNYKNYTILGKGGNDANGVIGEMTTTATDTGNTSTNVTISGLVADGVTLDAAGVYHISKPEGLVWMANEVNIAGNGFSGKTIQLDNNIDMKGVEYASCGGSVSNYPSGAFYGTFDGKGYTISNLTTTANVVGNYAAAGLFATAARSIIQNVNLTNVNITSTHYAGAVLGYTSGGTTIKNCTVNGGSVVSTPSTDNGSSYDNGDKVGGICGYASGGDNDISTITGCTAENLTIQGYRDLGGIAGCISAAPSVTNNTVKTVKILIDNTHNYDNKTDISQYNCGEVVGRVASGVVENNTATDVTIGFRK